MRRLSRSNFYDWTCSRARFAATFLTFLAACVMADGPAKPFNRAEATAIISDARKIVTRDGIERLEKVRMGGIERLVSIRGADRKNPVLLLIHGGPGYVSMPMSWWFTRGWEEYFRVVQWDQRALGKTYLLTDPAAIAPSLTSDGMIADAEEMAAWARKEFGKDKIFVLGHSWGSFLGLQLATRHPEWLCAYIGACQLTDGPESERRGWRFAVDAARRAKDAQAVRELEAIGPYAAHGKIIPIKDLYTFSRNGLVSMAERWLTGATTWPTAGWPISPLTIATRKSATSGEVISSPLRICSRR
jgi:proline iminopeptidase